MYLYMAKNFIKQEVITLPASMCAPRMITQLFSGHVFKPTYSMTRFL